MIKLGLKAVITLLILLVSINSYSQKIDSILNIYANYFQQEKIHIHFDKAMYNKGETIWYKSYILAGTDLTTYSKNIYVDWFDDKGRLLKHTVAPIAEASARGQLEIPENYAGKWLHVKAYTQWMLNFDTAFVYHKDVQVLQLNAPQQAIDTPTTTLKLFPEGGNLVEGIINRVAFMAYNQYGLPVKVNGIIKNDKGELIDSFKSEHNGLGSFVLIPDAAAYTAVFTDEYKREGSTSLPVANKSGATLQLKWLKNRLVFSVTRSEVEVPATLKQVHVVATMHQNVVYRSKINLNERTGVTSEIPTKELPTGVLQVALFDANYVPIAERVVFVNNYEFLFKPEVVVTKAGLTKRAKNTIEISVNDTLLSNMSVAITDAELPTDNSSNIVSSLLLSGDVKGYIHNPAYYFTSKADSVTQQLDLVMLTHGWRKINWKEVSLGQKPFITKPIETNYMELKGTVYGMNYAGIKGDPTILMILQAKDSSKQNLFLPIDRSGNFVQKDIFFYDTIKVFYQLTGDKNAVNRSEVRMNAGFLGSYARNYKSNLFSPYLYSFFKSDSLAQMRAKLFLQEQERLAKQLKQALLNEVTVKTRVKSEKEKLDEKYAKGLFAGSDAVSFDVMNDLAAQGQLSVFNYLQGRVAGLQISTGGGIGGEPTLTWRGGTPSLFLDEVITDAQQLQNIPMNDIAYIKVFRPPFFGAPGGGAGGAIVVYTRKGGDVKQEPGKGLPSISIAGYTPYKEFFSPDYEKTSATLSTDVRSTLYWNPYILTDKKNNTVQIQFFNNDISKRFRLVLEGVNEMGKLTRIEKIIE